MVVMEDAADRNDGHDPGNSSDGESLAGAELMASLAPLIDSQPGDLPDGTVIDGLVGLIDLAGRVDAAVARFAGAFDARALGAIDGARTTGSWLAARTELSRQVAGGAVRTGRRLLSCPHVDAAARAGRLGHAKVAKLLAARVDVEDLFAEHEHALVDDVEPMTVDRASRYIDRWRQIALATVGLDDGPEPAGDTSRNRLKMSRTFQGRWALDADLDAQNGEAMINALDDWIDRKVKAGVIDPTDGRDRAALRAEALLALTGIGNDHQTGEHQPRASINLSWDADDLLGKDLADLAELDRRNCTTSGGTTLAHDRASELMCNAEVVDLLVRFGFDHTRTILGVTHTRRYPTDHERRALHQRDGGCVFPGCDAPIHWCHAQHITPYEIGKVTRLDDLVLVCGRHHRAIHRDFTLERDHGTGHVTVTRPDGTQIPTTHCGPGGGERGRNGGRSSPRSAGQGTKLPGAPPRKRSRFTSRYLEEPTRPADRGTEPGGPEGRRRAS